MSEAAEKTIWELQEELRQWHDTEYIQEYPGSEFITGRTLASHGTRSWEELTPEEQERKERAAYATNKLLFGLGVNVSGNFREVAPVNVVTGAPDTNDVDPFLDSDELP